MSTAVLKPRLTEDIRAFSGESTRLRPSAQSTAVVTCVLVDLEVRTREPKRDFAAGEL